MPFLIAFKTACPDIQEHYFISSLVSRAITAASVAGTQNFILDKAVMLVNYQNYDFKYQRPLFRITTDVTETTCMSLDDVMAHDYCLRTMPNRPINRRSPTTKETRKTVT